MSGKSSLMAIHRGLWSVTACQVGAMLMPASVTRHAAYVVSTWSMAEGSCAESPGWGYLVLKGSVMSERCALHSPISAVQPAMPGWLRRGQSLLSCQLAFQSPPTIQVFSGSSIVRSSTFSTSCLQ